MSEQPNPYAPPQAPTDMPPVSMDTCPRCKSTSVHRPGFTWWGGAIGPRLLSHAVCKQCGFGYNYKTGKSNSTAIGVYFGVVFVLAIIIVTLVNSR